MSDEIAPVPEITPKMREMIGDLRRKINKARPLISQIESGELRFLTEDQQRQKDTYPTWVSNLELLQKGIVPPPAPSAQSQKDTKQPPSSYPSSADKQSAQVVDDDEEAQQTDEAEGSEGAPLITEPENESGANLNLHTAGGDKKKKQQKLKGDGTVDNKKVCTRGVYTTLDGEVVEIPKDIANLVKTLVELPKKVQTALTDAFIKRQLNTSHLTSITKELDDLCKLRRDILTGKIPEPTSVQQSRLKLIEIVKKEMTLENERLKAQGEKIKLLIKLEFEERMALLKPPPPSPPLPFPDPQLVVPVATKSKKNKKGKVSNETDIDVVGSFSSPPLGGKNDDAYADADDDVIANISNVYVVDEAREKQEHHQPQDEAAEYGPTAAELLGNRLITMASSSTSPSPMNSEEDTVVEEESTTHERLEEKDEEEEKVIEKVLADCDDAKKSTNNNDEEKKEIGHSGSPPRQNERAQKTAASDSQQIPKSDEEPRKAEDSENSSTSEEDEDEEEDSTTGLNDGKFISTNENDDDDDNLFGGFDLFDRAAHEKEAKKIAKAEKKQQKKENVVDRKSSHPEAAEPVKLKEEVLVNNTAAVAVAPIIDAPADQPSSPPPPPPPAEIDWSLLKIIRNRVKKTRRVTRQEDGQVGAADLDKHAEEEEEEAEEALLLRLIAKGETLKKEKKLTRPQSKNDSNHSTNKAKEEEEGSVNQKAVKHIISDKFKGGPNESKDQANAANDDDDHDDRMLTLSPTQMPNIIIDEKSVERCLDAAKQKAQRANTVAATTNAKASIATTNNSKSTTSNATNKGAAKSAATNSTGSSGDNKKASTLLPPPSTKAKSKAPAVLSSIHNNVVARVQRELLICLQNPLPTVKIVPSPDNTLLWHMNVSPTQGPMAGVVIPLTMHFGELYPQIPPVVRCSHADIPHPSIVPNDLYRDTLCFTHTAPGQWTPAHGAFSILSQLQSFFNEENFYVHSSSSNKKGAASSTSNGKKEQAKPNSKAPAGLVVVGGNVGNFKHRILVARADCAKFSDPNIGHFPARPFPPVPVYNGPFEPKATIRIPSLLLTSGSSVSTNGNTISNTTKHHSASKAHNNASDSVSSLPSASHSSLGTPTTAAADSEAEKNYDPASRNQKKAASATRASPIPPRYDALSGPGSASWAYAYANTGKHVFNITVEKGGASSHEGRNYKKKNDPSTSKNTSVDFIVGVASPNGATGERIGFDEYGWALVTNPLRSGKGEGGGSTNKSNNSSSNSTTLPNKNDKKKNKNNNLISLRHKGKLIDIVSAALLGSSFLSSPTTARGDEKIIAAVSPDYTDSASNQNNRSFPDTSQGTNDTSCTSFSENDNNNSNTNNENENQKSANETPKTNAPPPIQGNDGQNTREEEVMIRTADDIHVGDVITFTIDFDKRKIDISLLRTVAHKTEEKPHDDDGHTQAATTTTSDASAHEVVSYPLFTNISIPADLTSLVPTITINNGSTFVSTCFNINTKSLLDFDRDLQEKLAALTASVTEGGTNSSSSPCRGYALRSASASAAHNRIRTASSRLLQGEGKGQLETEEVSEKFKKNENNKTSAKTKNVVSESSAEIALSTSATATAPLRLPSAVVIEAARKPMRCIITLAGPLDDALGISVKIARDPKTFMPTTFDFTNYEYVAASAFAQHSKSITLSSSKNEQAKKKGGAGLSSSTSASPPALIVLPINESHARRNIELIKNSISLLCRNPLATLSYTPPFKSSNVWPVAVRAVQSIVSEPSDERPLASRLESYYHVVHVLASLVSLVPKVEENVLMECLAKSNLIGGGADLVAGTIGALAALFPTTSVEGSRRYTEAIKDVLLLLTAPDTRSASGVNSKSGGSEPAPTSTSPSNNNILSIPAVESAFASLPRSRKRQILAAGVFGSLVRRDALDALTIGLGSNNNNNNKEDEVGNKKENNSTNDHNHNNSNTACSDDVFRGLCLLEGTFTDVAYTRVQSDLDDTDSLVALEALLLLSPQTVTNASS